MMPSKTFEGNLIAAILLVIFIVFLTMGARSALVVSSSIPITVMTTFVFMGAFGIILHQVSISSLIVCLGLLVANAIVANDNMYLHLSQGKERNEAIIGGIKEVRIPILTSTLTTIASFLPLIMMKGVAGKFVKDLPIMVTIALSSSYLISLTVVPAMGYTFLKEKKKEEDSTKKRKLLAQKLGDWFNNLYDGLLLQALKKPKTTIFIAVAALAMTIYNRCNFNGRNYSRRN